MFCGGLFVEFVLLQVTLCWFFTLFVWLRMNFDLLNLRILVVLLLIDGCRLCGCMICRVGVLDYWNFRVLVFVLIGVVVYALFDLG